MRVYYRVGIFFVVVMALLTIFPYFFGFAAQRYAQNFVRDENQTLSKVFNATVSLDKYQRGWFCSTATLLIQREQNGSLHTVQSIPLVIKHGPFYRVQKRLAMGLGSMTNASPILDPSSPFLMTFDEAITFNGHHHLLLNLTAKQNISFIGDVGFQSLQLRGFGNINAKNFVFLLTANGIQLKDSVKTYGLHIEQLNANLQAIYVKDRHWQLTFGVSGDKAAFSAVDLSTKQSIADATLKQMEVSGLHFDTENMAQIASTLLQFKSSHENNQPIPIPAWISAFQQLISNAVDANTKVFVDGLTINTPMGQANVRYQVSFPGLLPKHDYFDVATHDVGFLNVDVPQAHFVSDQNNLQMKLSQFAFNTQDNMIYSRQAKMSFDELNMDNVRPTDPKWTLYANGFLYRGDLNGDASTLSQHMNWKLNKFCWTDNCFSNINLGLQFDNMDTTAFRQLANTMQQAMQNTPDPNQPQLMAAHWLDLLNAYASLVGPNTKINLTHAMTTPKGEVNLAGNLSWPQFPAAHTFSALIQQAAYQLRLNFPVYYVNEILNSARQPQKPAVDQAATTPNHPSENTSAAETQEKSLQTPTMQAAVWINYAIQKGYLEQKGDSYWLNLDGHGNQVTINGKAWEAPPSADQSTNVGQPVSTVAPSSGDTAPEAAPSSPVVHSAP